MSWRSGESGRWGDLPDGNFGWSVLPRSLFGGRGRFLQTPHISYGEIQRSCFLFDGRSRRTDERMARLLDERMARLLDQRMALLLDERMAWLLDERMAWLLDERTARLSNERCTRLRLEEWIACELDG